MTPAPVPQCVWRALATFGAPTGAPGVQATDLQLLDLVVQIGLPPRRIDLLTGVTGLEFDEAWSTRVVHRVGDLDVDGVVGVGPDGHRADSGLGARVGLRVLRRFLHGPILGPGGSRDRRSAGAAANASAPFTARPVRPGRHRRPESARRPPGRRTRSNRTFSARERRASSGATSASNRDSASASRPLRALMSACAARTLAPYDTQSLMKAGAPASTGRLRRTSFTANRVTSSASCSIRSATSTGALVAIPARAAPRRTRNRPKTPPRGGAGLLPRQRIHPAPLRAHDSDVVTCGSMQFKPRVARGAFRRRCGGFSRSRGPHPRILSPDAS